MPRPGSAGVRARLENEQGSADLAVQRSAAFGNLEEMPRTSYNGSPRYLALALCMPSSAGHDEYAAAAEFYDSVSPYRTRQDVAFLVDAARAAPLCAS